MILSSLIGSYLDLLFIGSQLYSFPNRPLPSVFSINILFTLVGLPTLMRGILMLMQNWSNWKRRIFIIIISLGMAALEKKAEEFGFFVHSKQWNHLYTIIGYFLFLQVVSRFHLWINKNDDKF
ncbi:CBO0543 family protein [Peribacillus alkalitolerans]|uniref:CBO0543 family protein n=1 Tax=Peribacillus alkalitolerans TaxID=1550385 RepID=UPI0030841E6C